MINRRRFLELGAGAGAALTLSPAWLRALQPHTGDIIHRAIPSSGERLPVISYGPRATDGAAMREVLRTLIDNGGKVVDVLHGGPAAEQAVRTAAAELGVQNRLFWTTVHGVYVPVLPGYSGAPPGPGRTAVRAAIEEKFAAFKVPVIDLVMVGSSVDVATHLDVLGELKKEGRVRYIGIHHLAFPPNAPQPTFGPLESIMRNEEIDFIGTDYSVGDRRLEEKLLPLAQERKIGVMAYFPFDRRRIFERASSMPLPDWAAEFDATTWAQFFLKYVISHPAVTVVRTGTTKPHHMLENLNAGTGRLPDEAMRRRMAQLVDSLPPTPAPTPPQGQPQQGQPPQSIALSATMLDRYVGEYTYEAARQSVTIRRAGDRLLMKVEGNAPEGPLLPRSETRFQGPFSLVFDFQLDEQGRVTGAIVEQGPNRMTLVRK